MRRAAVLLEDELVDRRGMLSTEQLHAHGLVGALGTTAAIMLRWYLILGLLWLPAAGGRWVPAFTRGLTVASVGLIFTATLGIGRRTGRASLAVFVVALAMAQLLK
jgi:chromate transport protein ChrA